MCVFAKVLWKIVIWMQWGKKIPFPDQVYQTERETGVKKLRTISEFHSGWIKNRINIFAYIVFFVVVVVVSLLQWSVRHGVCIQTKTHKLLQTSHEVNRYRYSVGFFLFCVCLAFAHKTIAFTSPTVLHYNESMYCLNIDLCLTRAKTQTVATV